jgi:hypothetical protein
LQIHTQYDAYVEERLSNARIQYTPMYMLSRFLGIMGAFLAVHLLFEYNDWYLKHPWVRIKARSKIVLFVQSQMLCIILDSTTIC